MSYEALSTYIRKETGRVFLPGVLRGGTRGVRENRGVCVRRGELIVNIGGLRRHLLYLAALVLSATVERGVRIRCQNECCWCSEKNVVPNNK